MHERYQNQVVPISEHSAENHENMTLSVDSMEDAGQTDGAWLFSRGNQSSHSESQRIFTSQDERDYNHDSLGSSGQQNYNMFNSQPTSDYSNQAQHPFYQSPKATNSSI